MDLILITIFKWTAIVAAIGVVNVHNPVHAVLLLITVFVCVGAILLIIQAEFLALLYIVVYVGAIAVLFLFVIMCLNVKIAEITTAAFSYMPLAALLVVLLAFEIVCALNSVFNINPTLIPKTYESTYTNWIDLVDPMNNIEVIGQTLFLFYTLPFILVGIILYIAMVGSIVLTLSHYQGVRRQVIWLQSEASFANSVRLIV